MKSHLTRLFVLIAFNISIWGWMFAIPASAGEEQCSSPRGGYCIKITQDHSVSQKNSSPLLAQIAGIEFLQIRPDASIGTIITEFYKFGIIFVGIAGITMMVIGGIYYMVGKVDTGKKLLSNSIWGIILALISWLILFTINPGLVTKLDLKLNPLKPSSSQGGGGGGTPGQLAP